MKNTIYLIAGILVFAFASCGGDSDYDYEFPEYESTYVVYLDNALDTTALVSITEEGSDSTMEFEVMGYGMEQIELKEKKYHITAVTATDSSFLDEDFTIDGTGYSYNLNLTKQDYIMERVTYVVSENPELYSTSKSFTYNGKTYDEVDATVIKGALVIPTSWDYNLEDEMPEEVSVDANASETTRTKLYRSETFMLYLELYEMFNDMDLDLDDY